MTAKWKHLIVTPNNHPSMSKTVSEGSKSTEAINILEKLAKSVWHSKPIWSLNLNFDNGEVDKLEKEKSE